MPVGRRVVPALLLSAITASLLTAQTSLHATAAPDTAGPAATASAAAAGGKAPAWLADLRKQSIRYVNRNGAPAALPKPTLSLVPRPEQQDWVGWRQATNPTARAAAVRRAAHAKARAAVAAPTPRFVAEDEPAGMRGSNDTLRSAQRLRTLGTRRGADAAVRVLGRLSPAPRPDLVAQPPSREDDGDLRTARDTGVSKVRRGFKTTGTIGDAPARPGEPDPEDADIYKLTLRAGELVETTVTRTSGNLEPVSLLVDGDGDVVAWADFTPGSASQLSTTVRAAGTYYLVTIGVMIIYLDTGEVVRTEGGYSLTITARPGDRDLYAVNLTAGDVLGVSVADAAGYVSVYEANGTEVHGSPQDASFVYPATSPLPGGGNAVTDHVARRTGTHFVEVTSGDGRYSADLEVYRYGGAAKKQTQTVFLDTDGQRLNTNVFGGRGVTTLSPLRAFLGRWGLGRSAERALVNRIKATVRENLEADLRAAGVSRWVDVKVVTSLDGPDRFGQPGVTRVIIGGTIRESGIPTIGVAQSIDPGNFDREESALVLLDALSAPGDRNDGPRYSLNSYLTSRSDRIGFVGRAIGNVTAHEVGHLIGNWHVDEQNAKANIMDAGGNFAQLFGVGPDRIGGTRDDRDVDFGKDRFNRYEGFTGIEDTLARSAWGMSRRP